MSRRPSLSGHVESTNNVPAKLRSLVGAQKPDIKITLNSRRSAFSTLDKIDGSVAITAPVDLPFSDVEIEFVGTSRTYVERLTTAAAVSGRAEAFHQFLKLSQPGLERHYPRDGVLRAHETYTFPFVFVVPPQLLPRICQHKIHSPNVRDAHLCLPPTFGDKDLADRDDMPDDMAPEMASIRYGVFAKVNRVKYTADIAPTRLLLGSKAKNIRIIPAIEEQAPLDINSTDAEYCMRKEKSVRKGVLKGKSGTLVMEATQPPALKLKVGSEVPATTMATIKLRFDPSEDNCTPPKLGSLVNKLKVVTFFASSARQNFPSKSASLLDLSQGVHAEQLQLSHRCVANVEWTKVDPSKQEIVRRRDSACSVIAGDEEPSPSTHYKGRSYYTARVVAPVTLPKNKTFVPTFHSCLVSRSYFLKLELAVPAAGGMGASFELKIPLQISSEGTNGSASPGRRPSIASEMEEEIGSENSARFFEPRMMRVPRPDYVGHSRIGSPVTGMSPANSAPSTPASEELPPGYSPFGAPDGPQPAIACS